MGRNLIWGIKKKRKSADIEDDNDDNNENDISKNISLIMNSSSNSSIVINFNHIYFNNDITTESAFNLNNELRNTENKMKIFSATYNIPLQPIYLHLTTDGGLIYSAFSIIDCIKSLSVPVHTIIDGFVASAGTLISLAGEKRYMNKNSYMLIHELRGGVWGKMSEIEDEFKNIKRIMKHLMSIYLENTKLKKNELEKILKKDIIWDLDECIKYGLVHEEYKHQTI